MTPRISPFGLSAESLVAGLHREAGDAVVNDAFTRMTGDPAGDAVGNAPRKRQGADADPRSPRRIGQTRRRWRTCREAVPNCRKGGWTLWVELSPAPVVDTDGRFRVSVPGRDPARGHRATAGPGERRAGGSTRLPPMRIMRSAAQRGAGGTAGIAAALSEALRADRMQGPCCGTTCADSAAAR